MLDYLIVFIGIICILCIALTFRVHIKQGINNLSFKHRYSIAVKGSKKPMARQTEQAYIKGLNHGYALAKAQYENRSAILYCSPSEYICQRCGHRIDKDKIATPHYCNNCGSVFYTVQATSYDPNNDLE